jgi:hypothetical protein
MAFIKEAYTENRVEMIYELLKKDAENGSPREYDVMVDGLKVVSKNNDPGRFYDFEQFVLPESSNITINIHERSHRSMKYILLLQQEEPTQGELSGLDSTIAARMKQERAKWEHKKLEEDYNDCLRSLKECEEFSRELQDRIHTLEMEKGSSSGQLTNAIVGLAGAYISSNPGALNGIPVIGSLFGDSKRGKAEENRECICGNTPTEFTGQITVGDDTRMKAAIIPYFKEEYREQFMKVLHYFFHNNHFIDQTVNGIENLLGKEKAEERIKKTPENK